MPDSEAPSPSSAPGADGTPLIRTRFLHEWLANMEREPERVRSRFFAILPADVRQRIEQAPRTGWLDARLHVLLADVTLEAMGEARAHEYYRRAFARSLRGPFFASTIRAGTRLFGLNPGSFLRWSGRAYEATLRNCGRVHGEILGEGRGVLVYSELPDFCTASDAWLDSAQGSVYGAYDMVGASGVARLDKSQRAQGRMRIDLEWTMPTRPRRAASRP